MTWDVDRPVPEPRAAGPNGEDARVSGRSWRAGAVIAALLAVRMVCLVGAFVVPFAPALNGADVVRVWEIAHERGEPYRDFPVEYGPLTTLVDQSLLNAPTVPETEWRLALFNVLCDGLVVVAIATWGTRAVIAYLALSTPIMAFVYFRTDLLPVALLVAGIALALKGSERIGGLSVALGVVAKLWPAIAIPTLMIERRRAGVWALVATGVSIIAWIIWSPSGPWDVLSFRHATGWQIESTIGAILLTSGADPRLDQGAWRVGWSLPIARPLLILLLVIGVAFVWRYRRDTIATTLAATAMTLFLAPILSPQYVIWLLPLAAICWARGDLDLATPMAISLLTLLVTALFLKSTIEQLPSLLTAVILVRNALLLLLAYQVLHARPRRDMLGRWVNRVSLGAR
jgi:Glycosyltransferase family 87